MASSKNLAPSLKECLRTSQETLTFHPRSGQLIDAHICNDCSLVTLIKELSELKDRRMKINYEKLATDRACDGPYSPSNMSAYGFKQKSCTFAERMSQDFSGNFNISS